MPIKIIDGFQVNTASPIDTRIVASGSAARNAIQNKYHGLRVFDISNNVPYVWNGTAWIGENSSGIIGSGTSTYFPIFNSSNSLFDSLLYQDSGVIKTGDDGGGDGLVEISPYYGTVTVQGGFVGNGSGISSINASNINSGSLALSRLANGSTGWLLSGSSPNPTYINPNQITVGTASVATQSTITNTTSNTNNFITFVSSSSGNSQIRVNSSGLLYNPSTNVLTTGNISVNNVRFPATQVTSTDPNTLDDYEEGTKINNLTTQWWSSSTMFGPVYTIINLPLAVDIMNYIKIGKNVTVSGRIRVGNLSSLSSQISLSLGLWINLPYPPAGPSSATLRYLGFSSSFNNYILQAYTTGSSTLEFVAYRPSDRSEYYDLAKWLVSNQTDIYYSMSYVATS